MRYVQFRMFNVWHVIRWEGTDEEHQALCGRYRGWGVHRSQPPSGPDIRVCYTCQRRMEGPQEREARRLAQRARRVRSMVVMEDDEVEEDDEAASHLSSTSSLPSQEFTGQPGGSVVGVSALDRAADFLLREAQDRYRQELDAARLRGDWSTVQTAAGKLTELDALLRDLRGETPPR
jgi:hypothetical protein